MRADRTCFSSVCTVLLSTTRLQGICLEKCFFTRQRTLMTLKLTDFLCFVLGGEVQGNVHVRKFYASAHADHATPPRSLTALL